MILLDFFGFSKQNHTFLQKHMVSLRKSKENQNKSKKCLGNPKNPIIFSFWAGRGGGGRGGEQGGGGRGEWEIVRMVIWQPATLQGHTPSSQLI